MTGMAWCHVCGEHEHTCATDYKGEDVYSPDDEPEPDHDICSH